MRAPSFRPAGRRHVLGIVFDLGGRNLLLCSRGDTWPAHEVFGGVARDRERSRDAMVRWFGQQGPAEAGELSWRGFGRMVVKDEVAWLFYAKVRTDVLEAFSRDAGKFRVVPVSTLGREGVLGAGPIDSKLCYLAPMAVNHARGIDDVLFYEIVLTDRNFEEGS